MSILKNIDSKRKLGASILIILGLICLLVAAILEIVFENPNFVEKLSGIILLSMAEFLIFSGAWNALQKSPTTEEILEMGGISENISQSGIIRYFRNFNDVEWKELFDKAKSATFFFTYAYGFTSRTSHLSQEMIKRGGTLTVILPDFNVDTIMDSLDYSFKYGKYSLSDRGNAVDVKENENSKLSVRARIKEAADTYIHLGAKVYLYKGDIRTTYYLFDHTCVFAPFNHCKTKQFVPGIMAESGKCFYEFCKLDIDEILQQSIEYEVNYEENCK